MLPESVFLYYSFTLLLSTLFLLKEELSFSRLNAYPHTSGINMSICVLSWPKPCDAALLIGQASAIAGW